MHNITVKIDYPDYISILFVIITPKKILMVNYIPYFRNTNIQGAWFWFKAVFNHILENQDPPFTLPNILDRTINILDRKIWHTRRQVYASTKISHAYTPTKYQELLKIDQRKFVMSYDASHIFFAFF